MEFMDKMAAQAADKFKETAGEVWEALGGQEASKSNTVRQARFSAGKYAVLATMVLMMNYPDNARLFRQGFNVNGNGPTGVDEFAATKSVTANKIARMLHNTNMLAEALSIEAIAATGRADPTATSTLTDLMQLLPILARAIEEEKPKKRKGSKK